MNIKKSLLSILFLCISISAFAIPSCNPWLKTWNLKIGADSYKIEFVNDLSCKNIETGELYKYDWATGKYLKLIMQESKGSKKDITDEEEVYVFKIELNDSEDSMTGKDLERGIKVSGKVIE